MFWFLVPLLLGYVSGSIPAGIIIGKRFKGIDLREVGSGNIGTANAIRALGPFWGGIVFLCDVLKGTLPVLFSVLLLPRLFPGLFTADSVPYLMIASGLGAVVGHNNSLFLGFSGGKGIATSFGVFVVLDYRSALLAFGVWIGVVIITKLSSLGSLLGALSVPLLMLAFKMPANLVIFGFVVTGIAFYKHRENIGRLLRGEERKITDKTVGESSKKIGSDTVSEEISSDVE